MKKSAKRLLGVVFTLALMTILACGAFAAKPAVEVMVTRINTDSVGGVSPLTPSVIRSLVRFEGILLLLVK